jgi:hypothetical protein
MMKATNINGIYTMESQKGISNKNAEEGQKTKNSF